MADITGDGINDVDIRALASSSTVNDVIFRQGTIGAGTGNFDSFLRLQASPTESGFNANTDSATNSEIKTGTWTHTIKLSDIPIKVVGGVQYYEFRLDINESNSNLISAQISLDTFKLYTSANGNIVDKAVLEAQNLAYNMDGAGNVSVLMSDAYSSGSGNSDYSVLVPVTSILGPDLTNPLVDPVTTYLYLYSQFGFAGANYQTTSTFEEWNVEHAVSLVGVKFNDINNDGQRQANGVDGIAGTADDEVGVAGVTIQLQDSAGNVLRTTTTNSTGTYTFYGVSTGVSYRVDEVVPTGSNQTTGDYETVAIADGASGTVTVDPIGNHYPVPHVLIDKAFVNVTDGPDPLGGSTVINGAGDVANYTIDVTNDGETALTGVSVTDAASVAGAVAVQSGGFNTGDIDHDNVLDVGETWHYTATQLATQSDIDTNGGGDGDKDNSATVVATQQGTANTVTATDSASAPIVPSAAIGITKVFTGWTGGNGNTVGDAVGDVANYTIVVTNTGNVTLTNVHVTDPLTGNDYNVGTLAPGASSSNLLEQYVITQGDLDGAGKAGSDHDIDNTATATSTQTGPAAASATAPLVYNPLIDVTKTVTSVVDGPDAFNAAGANGAGDTINYAITIANTGNVSLTGVTVTDKVEAYGATNATYVSGDSAVTGTIGVLDVGETWNYTASYVLTQADIDGKGGGDGLLDNLAKGDTNETPEDTATANVPLAYLPSIDVTKTVTSVVDGPDAFNAAGANGAGDTINYAITIANTGNVSLTGVTVTDKVEAYGATNATYVSGDSAVTGTIGVLDVGETWNYTASYVLTQADIDGKGGGDGLLDNLAKGDTNETPEDTATANVPLAYLPSIDVTKTVTSVVDGPDAFNAAGANGAGDTINYAITIANTGNVSLTGVTVTDKVEAYGATNATYVSGDSAVTGTIGVLDVGETWNYTASYVLTQADIDGKGGGDGLLDNLAKGDTNETPEDTATANVPLAYLPSIDVTKTVTSVVDGPDAFNAAGANGAGDTINYAITIANTGNVSLTGVTVTDKVEAYGATNATYVSGDSAVTGTIGVLDVGETWNYTASYVLTQADIDGKGGGDGLLDNLAKGDTNETPEDTATANVPLAYLPSIDVTKTVTSVVDGPDAFNAAGANGAGDTINYAITIANTGNVSLTGVTVTDKVEAYGATNATYVSGDSAVTGTIGVLDVGETWNYTASYVLTQADIDGKGGGDGLLDNLAKGDTNETPEDTATANVPLAYLPSIDVTKTVTSVVDGPDAFNAAGANGAGDTINYAITIANTGNVSLTGVTVTDKVEAYGATNATYVSGDSAVTGTIGVLDVGETWNYTASYVLTQADIDGKGGGDGLLDNLAKGDTNETPEDTATANVPLAYNPALTVVKEVRTDVVTTFTDANDPNGLAASTSSTVDFHVLITNTGNITLSGISIDDDVVHTVAGVPSSEQLNYTTQNAWVDLDHSGTRALDGSENWATLDANNDGTLDTVTVGVGQNLNIYYSLTSLLGQHENTAKVTTAQGASGQDDANYYVLPTEDCVGVRTPGFWQNSKWATFWDAKGAAQSDQGDSWGGAENQPTQAGSPGFADGELVYKVYLAANDSDSNGSYTTDEKGAPSQGLLIGDYNMNGITDAGEDTLFIGLNDAKTLINASNKQLTGSQGDGAFMLGRDMVATWLNYLANNQEGSGGNCVGTVGGATNTPHEYLDAAIDWMQAFESNMNGTGNPGSAANQATFQFDKAIKTSTADWNNAYTGGAGTADDIPVSASAMHSALDGYNNTGSIGGIEYCCDADDPLALLALQQVA